MDVNVTRELAALQRLGVPQLRDRYAEAFGERPATNNRAWLLKRLAWRILALAEGDLSERARRRAAELARDADLRLNPPRVRGEAAAPGRTQVATLESQADGRLPPPGTVITRPYKGRTLQVQVLAHGFEYEGAVYRSLSAVAKAVTGVHCNGFLFFRLKAQPEGAAHEA
jgi:hypothetical protein